MKKNLLQAIMVFLIIISLVSCQTSNKNNTSSTDESSAESSETFDENSVTSKKSDEINKKNESQKTQSEKANLTLTSPVRLVAMKGPTAMGLAKYTSDLSLLESEPNSSESVSETSTDKSAIVDFEIMTMPDQVAAGLIKGEIDLACIPANMAATVYNKSEGKIQVAAINVSNVLYFAANNVELSSLEDLRGKTIYATGKGATPEVILNNLLAKAGLTIGTDVTVNYYPEATEVASLLQAEEGAIALLQEPFLSSVLLKNQQIDVALNVNELWREYFSKATGENSESDTDNNAEITTGVLVVQKEFFTQNPEWFEQFLADYQASVEWVNQNPVEASKIIDEQGIIGAAVAEKAIPNCGITLLTGQDMKSKLTSYLEILATTNPELVGGKLPEADFYYENK